MLGLWFGCFLYCGVLLLAIGLFAGLVVLSLLIVWTFTFRGCLLLLRRVMSCCGCVVFWFACAFVVGLVVVICWFDSGTCGYSCVGVRLFV